MKHRSVARLSILQAIIHNGKISGRVATWHLIIKKSPAARVFVFCMSGLSGNNRGIGITFLVRNTIPSNDYTPSENKRIPGIPRATLTQTLKLKKFLSKSNGYRIASFLVRKSMFKFRIPDNRISFNLRSCENRNCEA